MNKLERIDPISLANNPRASLRAWLKYEPMIVAAFRQHPRPYTYKPRDMSPASVASKARDAVRGKLAFDYPSEISSTDLLRWYGEVIFKADAESVYIGPPRRAQELLQGNSVDQNIPSNLSFETLSFEEVTAFTLLLSNNRIKGPVKILHPPDVSLAPPRANIQMIRTKDGSLVLL